MLLEKMMGVVFGCCQNHTHHLFLEQTSGEGGDESPLFKTANNKCQKIRL